MIDGDTLSEDDSIERRIRRFMHEFLAIICGDRKQRFYKLACENRPILSDDEFFEKYYKGMGIDRDSAIGVRKIVAKQLAFARVIPNDNIYQIFDDIPVEEIAYELAEEFGFRVEVREFLDLDGSLDSLVRHVADKRQDMTRHRCL